MRFYNIRTLGEMLGYGLMRLGGWFHGALGTIADVARHVRDVFPQSRPASADAAARRLLQARAAAETLRDTGSLPANDQIPIDPQAELRGRYRYVIRIAIDGWWRSSTGRREWRRMSDVISITSNERLTARAAGQRASNVYRNRLAGATEIERYGLRLDEVEREERYFLSVTRGAL